QQRGAFCTMQLVELDLAPGESREFQASTRADEILGDSLPVGRYYFTALLRPNGRAGEVPAGEGDRGRCARGVRGGQGRAGRPPSSVARACGASARTGAPRVHRGVRERRAGADTMPLVVERR